MFKRLLLLASILLLAGAPNVLASVGVFDFSTDIGNPLGIGSTVYSLTDRYLISAGGADIWGENDQFHYAYNQVSGDVRISSSFAWQTSGWNDWAKMGVMLRESTNANSVHYSSLTRKGGGDPWALHGDNGDSIFAQRREGTGWGSTSNDYWGAEPVKMGVQRVQAGPYEVVQALVDQGSGWEAYWTGLRDLPDNILAGVAVTAHDDAWLVQAYASNVQYDSAPGLIGVKTAGDPLLEACGDVPGFIVTAAKMPVGWDWWDEDNSGGVDRWEQYKQAEYLAKNSGFTGYYPEDPTDYPSEQFGTAHRDLVNLYDSGGRNAFTGATETTFPGIDAFQVDPPEPADGDDDDRFAVLVEGCIELTEGLHVLGGAFDDGVLIRIGGVEIGRTNSWDETGQFLFEAPVAGIYSLEAIGFEGGGGAGLELYEWLDNYTMVLMGDVANGASPVYCVPEPATIALLGFGGLSMLRIRRKR